MASSAASSRQQQPAVVDVASLSLEQLVGLQRDLESEIQNLSVHLRSLRFAKNKLQESREALQLFCGLDSSGSKQQQHGDEQAAGKGEDSTLESTSGKRDGEEEDKKDDGKEDEEQMEVLVPLTGSLYVKGRLTTREKLLVDIGTGYWMEKTGEEANVRLERTSGKVNEQVTKVERVILEKQRQAEASRTLIQQKYLQQQLLQQQLLQQPGAAGNR